MAIVSPLFVASVASLTLAMTTIGATINLLQQIQIQPGQFGTNILKRTIWHQEKNDIQIIV